MVLSEDSFATAIAPNDAFLASPTEASPCFQANATSNAFVRRWSISLPNRCRTCFAQSYAHWINCWCCCLLRGPSRCSATNLCPAWRWGAQQLLCPDTIVSVDHQAAFASGSPVRVGPPTASAIGRVPWLEGKRVRHGGLTLFPDACPRTFAPGK